MADPVDPTQPPPVPSPGPEPSADPSSTDLPPNIAAAIACIPLVGGIIFYLLEKRNSFVRFYAMQSIIFGGAWFLFNIASSRRRSDPSISLGGDRGAGAFGLSRRVHYCSRESVYRCALGYSLRWSNGAQTGRGQRCLNNGATRSVASNRTARRLSLPARINFLRAASPRLRSKSARDRAAS